MTEPQVDLKEMNFTVIGKIGKTMTAAKLEQPLQEKIKTRKFSELGK